MSTNGNAPLLEVENVSKYFGNVIALKDVSTTVHQGQVTCVLGDNGAGKSTFIKILSGVHREDEGEIRMNGDRVTFGSPREAKERGIATVFQDLATVPLMSIWRNFFLGSEPTVGAGPLRRIDVNAAKRTMRDEMKKMGIDVRDPDQPVGTLSGGERQAVAIARAIHFGAKVLILDEPTSALGVRQTANVLATIDRVRRQGIGVVFITHNVRHAMAVGDRFTVLNRGKTLGTAARGEITPEELQDLMAGGQEMAELEASLGGTV
jgi:simple sugar transport system ATP-binding protein